MTNNRVGMGSVSGESRSREIPVGWLLAACWLAVYGFRFFQPGYIDPEEQRTGMLATGLRDGLASSPFYYEYAHTTGTLTFGVLLYPVYCWFGSRFVWIRLLGAFFVAGGVYFWTRAVRRAWGFAPALIFFLWTLAPPPFLEHYFHIAWANHSESLFFSGLLVLLFLRTSDAPPPFRRTLATGALAGFATFFCLENALVASVLAAIALWRWRWRGVARWAAPAALGFVAGFSPGLFTPRLPAHPLAVARTAARFFSLESWRRRADFLTGTLPHCAGYAGAAGKWLSFGWAALAALGAAAILWNAVQPKRRGAAPDPPDWLARVLVLHLTFFVLAYGFPEFSIRSHGPGDYYLMRHLVAVSLTMLALATYFLLRVGGVGKWLLLAPFLAGGFANLVSGSTVSAVALNKGFAELRDCRGDDYLYFVDSQLPVSWQDPAAAVRSVTRLPPRWRADGYFRAGAWFDPWIVLPIAAHDATLPEKARLRLAAGAGAAFAQSSFLAKFRTDGLDPEQRRELLSQLQNLPPAVAQSFAGGVGYGISEERGPLFGDVDAAAETQKRAEIAADLATVRGLLPQLNEREFTDAVLQGAARFLGYVDKDLLADEMTPHVDAWAGVLQTTFGVDARSLFRKSVSDGAVMRLMNERRRFVWRPGAVDPATLRDAFAERGIRLVRAAAEPHSYELVGAE